MPDPLGATTSIVATPENEPTDTRELNSPTFRPGPPSTTMSSATTEQSHDHQQLAREGLHVLPLIRGVRIMSAGPVQSPTRVLRFLYGFVESGSVTTAGAVL